MMTNNNENRPETKTEAIRDESDDDWQFVSVDGHGSKKYLQLKYAKKIEETHVDQRNKSIYSRKRYYRRLKGAQWLLLICTRYGEIRMRSQYLG